MQHIYCKLKKPLDCALLSLFIPIQLKSMEYRQIDGIKYLEAFKCTKEEFEIIKKCFDNVVLKYKIY